MSKNSTAYESLQNYLALCNGLLRDNCEQTEISYMAVRLADYLFFSAENKICVCNNFAGTETCNLN